MSYWAITAKYIFVVPLIMLVCAPLFRRSADHPESLFGYKSKRANETPDTWYFANTYIGKLWLKWGVISLAGTAAAFAVLYFLHAVAPIWPLILMGAQIVVVLATGLATEHALKEKLDKGGKLRP